MTGAVAGAGVRHLLADDDLSQAEQALVLDLAERLRDDPYAARPLAGPRSVAVVFDKPTLRTQASFSAGIAELGGFPMIVDGRLAGIGVRETVADVARVLGRQASAVVWRTFAQADLATMAAHAGVPVVNALTDDHHPCQILADLQTLRQHGRSLPGLTFAYVGDGANNMAASYVLGGVTAGMHVRVGAPEGFHPAPGLLTRAAGIGARTGGSVSVTDSPTEAVAGADAVATDTWVSMGQEAVSAEHGGLARTTIFAPYQVDEALLGRADADALFLHCLPAYRGLEVSEAVLEGPRSVVWDEAENRRHAQKAVLTFLLERSGLVDASGLLPPVGTTV